ncbi:hypothetical protein [Nonomuraea helvata]|uniref:PPE domain-containing protein n=1 Tax=Nonomuraea helvata TaxID=37484 RepID=A0ABV5RSU6_9ACTN
MAESVDSWEPIRLYDYLGDPTPDSTVTREKVVSYLNNTDPDKIESAGKSYIEAAKLVLGKDGIEGALWKAADELKEVWRGQGATDALKALRLLHASATALGEAMKQTGEPMTKYAERVRHYRATVPTLMWGQDPAADEAATYGLNRTGTTSPTTKSENTGGGTTGSPPSAATDVNAQARKHLEKLNNEITDLNAKLAEGLNFKMPAITPITVDTTKAPHINPGSGTNVPTGKTTYWHGGGNDGSGSTGSTGGGREGSDGRDDPGQGRDQTSGQNNNQDRPGQDQDKGQDQNDPSTGTQDPTSPQQPGDTSAQQPPSQSQDGTQQQDVPPVLGADNKTQLADASPPTTTTVGPHQSTTTPYTQLPTTTPVPTSTANPFTANPFTTVPGQPGSGGTWYGGGGTAATSPAVIGGRVPGSGSGLMGYPPVGGVGAGQEQRNETTREFYDPDGDAWSSPHPVGPEKIG